VSGVTSSDISGTSPGNPLVESILDLEFTIKPLLETMQVYAKKPATDNAYLAHVEARRTTLLTKTEPELRKLYAELFAIRRNAHHAQAAAKKAKANAKAAAKEAARFYNQPNAAADFDYWVKLDYWTFDESIALLLGKDPRIVTWKAVQRDIAPPLLLIDSRPPVSDFLASYETLRNIALRAQAMQGSDRLQPANVIAWGIQRAGVQPPLRLLELLPVPAASAATQVTAQVGDSELETTPTTSRRSPTAVLVKRAALKSLSYRWPTVGSDLRHSDQNGLNAAAKAPEHGLWREADALEWARRNGKLAAPAPAVGNTLESLSRMVHRADD
jgi:hypothetical protein